MHHSVRMLLFAAAAGLALANSAPAQSRPSDPTSAGAAQQFKSGADHLGRGAADIGEGIKQGAIVTWQALRDGAAEVASRFNGDRAASTHDPATPPEHR
jgi:hypothetical protein